MAPLFQTLAHVLARFPLWLLHALGWLTGWLAYAGSRSYRQHFAANAALAGVARSDRRKAIAAAGKLVLELPRLWMGKPVAIAWDGAVHIDAAFASGRGVVFLTPHLGCFEIAAQAYAARYGVGDGADHAVAGGKPMTVLFRPPRKAWLTDFVLHARARPGLKAAPTTLAGVKQLIKALKAQQCVGLLPDQVPPKSQGVWAEFFGREAFTMTLSARLAQQTGAVVLLAWGERLAGARGYTIHVRPMAQALEADLSRAVRQINQAMEQLIMECPSQYLWGYARYKAPNDELPGVGL